MNEEENNNEITLEQSETDSTANQSKQTNKNRTIAMIIGGAAIVVILILVGILFLFNHKSRNITAYDYAPKSGGVVVNFDTDVNLGDLVKTALPMIKDKLGATGADQYAAIINKLPNLEFLDAAGFVVTDPADTEKMLIGIRYSGRQDPKSGFAGVIETLKSFGLNVTTDSAGFTGIITGDKATPSEGKESDPSYSISFDHPLITFYLDSEHLLIAQDKPTIENALQIRNGKAPSIKENAKWERIQKIVGNSSVSFYAMVNTGKENLDIAGTIFSKNGEAGLKVVWLDGADQAKEMIKTVPMPIANIADILDWQKNLDGLVSATPEGTIRFAAPFAMLEQTKLTKGEMSGTVNIDMETSQSSATMKISAPKAELEKFVKDVFVGTTNDSKPVGDGVFMVSPKELKISEIEELFKKADPKVKSGELDLVKPTNPDESKNQEPVFSDDETEIMGTYDMATNTWKPNPITSMQANPYSEMFGNKDFYYKLDGDSLVMAQKKEDIAWKAGASEKVSGKLASIVLDGNKLIMAYISALPVSGIMTPGLNLESLPKLLEKLNLRMLVDLLTEGKDIVGLITIKYNPDPGILP